MTDELRTTLHRIADDLRPEPVDDDLWQRGRAARRRGHDLALAAVLVLVASVAGIGAWVLTDDRETQVAGTVVAEGAIPSRIVDIPADLEVTTDLAVGRGSAAFISASGDPVVITATDGLPHRSACLAGIRSGSRSRSPPTVAPWPTSRRATTARRSSCWISRRAAATPPGPPR